MVELNQLQEGLRGGMVLSSRNSRFQASGGTARPEWWVGGGVGKRVRAERWTGIWLCEPGWGVWPSVTISYWSVLVGHRLDLCFERLFSLFERLFSIVCVCVCMCVCVHHIFFIHPSVNVHLSCLHVLAIVNNACIFLNYSFVQIYAKEWRYWIIWQL